jgi:hypothetical protein
MMGPSATRIPTWKRALAGILALLAGLVTVWLFSLAPGLFVTADWFIGVALMGLALLGGGLTLALGRSAWRAANIPGWFVWAGALAVIALPIAFAMSFSNTYRTRVPMKNATSDMKSALSSLQYAQDAYFNERATYANELTALDSSQYAFRMDGVSVRITRADSTGWGARAEHTRVTAVCTIDVRAGLVGSPPGSDDTTCSEGEVR